MTNELDLKTITDMIAEITGPNTTGIALIASSDDEVKVRTFGDKAAIAQDVKAAAEALGGEK